MKIIILIFSFSTSTFSNTDSDILIDPNPKKYPLQIPDPCKDRKKNQGLFRDDQNSPGIDKDPVLWR